MENLNLDSLFNALIRPAVDYNFHQIAFSGVSFIQNTTDTISAFVASPYFNIEIENVNVKPKAAYFNYLENTWKEQLPYPVPLDILLDRLRTPHLIGKLTIPFTNIVNHLNKVDDTVKRRCRIVIAPTSKDEVFLPFNIENNRGVFRHPKAPKPFVTVDDSFIQPIHQGVVYRNLILEENDNSVVVNPYSLNRNKVRIGINYSESGFFPETMNDVNRMFYIPAEFIMGTDMVEQVPGTELPVVHLDCTLLYDIVRIFGLASPTFIEVHIGDNPNAPIIIRNVKNNPGDMQINVLMGTLNPYYGVQKR